MVINCSDISRWREGQIERLYKLCPGGKMLPKEQILIKLGPSLWLVFQCMQVKHLISKLRKHEIMRLTLVRV